MQSVKVQNKLSSTGKGFSIQSVLLSLAFIFFIFLFIFFDQTELSFFEWRKRAHPNTANRRKKEKLLSRVIFGDTTTFDLHSHPKNTEM